MPRIVRVKALDFSGGAGRGFCVVLNGKGAERSRLSASGSEREKDLDEVCWGFGTEGLAILASPVLSPLGGVCEGVEHALPEFIRWRVDARGGQRVLHVRREEGLDVRESGFDFSYLNVEESHGEGATFLELAA